MDITTTIAAERTDLAALLDGLSPAQWDEPSLCAGWRVREVAAHVSLGFRYRLPRLAIELLKARGDVNRMADRRARLDAAALSPAELAAAIRDNAHHPWRPPVGGVTAALAHDVIHGLDITVALGLERRVPRERLRLLLEHLTPRTARFFGADLAGVELRADDLAWSFGSGTPLVGAAQDLLLVAYGRKLPPGHLSGAAADRFSLSSGSGRRWP
ncbi:maleylpyruvate isomerase family mycothiol-dependent enzyme [Nonomuraea sp. FMUSA5-5]|uniref:Maleylpyruvate isomerase family mycothiol-dependent enzyme n=1 Tax=Nonomuraea composti TaxID=2720023 RepID=A0ABX1B720_9ACTN|nr:maleylpyruvate isomerase family mycothiol-dependent enzyme [Nonomuraea sp. FMUSA5-5]NJP90978.1 maleylpyruvate isomerase family mycothiol-dependent enzyme [Nonomuraea sp. FMUSA5-5]